MPILLGVILVVLAIVMLVWVGFNLLGWLFMLLIAGIVGWLADLIVPGKLPWGWLGTVLAGLAGSWLGVALLGRIGPDIAGISMFSALIGAVILAVVVSLVARATRRPGAM